MKTILTMLVTFLTTNFMALVCFNGQMAENMKGIGNKAVWKELESFIGLGVAGTRADSSAIKCKGRDYFIGQKNVQLRDAGMQVHQQTKQRKQFSSR